MGRYSDADGNVDFQQMRNDLIYMRWALDVENPDAWIDGVSDMVSDLIAEINKAVESEN